MTNLADVSVTRWTLFKRVIDEMGNQDEQWGVQHFPIHKDPVPGQNHYDSVATFYKNRLREARAEADEFTWHDILMEEVAEAFAEADPGLIIEEMIQVAALAIQICEDITLRGLK